LPAYTLAVAEEAEVALRKGLSRLSPRERDCVRAKFHLDGETRKLAAVADAYGITPQRASQILNVALDKLSAEVA